MDSMATAQAPDNDGSEVSGEVNRSRLPIYAETGDKSARQQSNQLLNQGT